METIIRSIKNSSNSNKNILLEFIEDINVKEIRLFSTIKEKKVLDEEEFSALPSLVAIVKYEIPAIKRDVYIVMDEETLSTKNTSQYLELKPFLNAAELRKNVFFGTELVPLTSTNSPRDAYEIIMNLNKDKFLKFSSKTRDIYFKLLNKSNFSEIDYCNNENIGFNLR